MKNIFSTHEQKNITGETVSAFLSLSTVLTVLNPFNLCFIFCLQYSVLASLPVKTCHKSHPYKARWNIIRSNILL